MEIDIYTDGSCLGNPGPGACAFIILYKGIEEKEGFFFPDTTNNRMELNAVILALKRARQIENTKITIYSDSSYVVNGINLWMEGWKKKEWKNIKNIDLWEEMLRLKKRTNFKIFWIKSHQGNFYNEKVDLLAKEILKKNYI